METRENVNYSRIAEAIDYIRTHFREQPSLSDVAGKVHLSPFHLQRMFREWAGTSPKKFLQYISIEYAKQLLAAGNTSLAEAAYATGLSGSSRLHDLFITIEGMTPAAYRDGGRNLQIGYSFAESTFGRVIIASTPKGICYLAFTDDDTQAHADLKQKFPNACLEQRTDALQAQALAILNNEPGAGARPLMLDLKGTDFQLKIWEALLKIPAGQLVTYSSLAAAAGQPGAARAAGTAIGSNPIAYLIPCHRVIQSSGLLGGYRWGETRKAAIIGWEAAQNDPETNDPSH